MINPQRKYLTLICVELALGLVVDFIRGDLLLFGIGGLLFFTLAAYTTIFFVWKYAQKKSSPALKVLSIIAFIVLLGLTLFYGVGSILWALAW